MSELLAALPRLFSLQRRDDYARLRRMAHRDLIAQRALARTVPQMNRAYVQVTQEKAHDTDAAAKRS